MLLGTAVVLAVLAAVGLVGSERYVVVHRLLGQPFALLLVATLALAGSFILLLRPRWLGVVIALGALGTGGWLFGLGLFFTSGFGEQAQVGSPNRDYEAVISNEFALIDPVYRVKVRQTHGLLARQWTVGCDEFVNDLRWDGSDTLVLLWDDRENPVEEVGRVKIDPSSGRPLGTSPLSRC